MEPARRRDGRGRGWGIPAAAKSRAVAGHLHAPSHQERPNQLLRVDPSVTSPDWMRFMFGIGTVARLAGVSVRTLRYYDEIGLLRPVWVDPNTGYRWYAPEQLRRLHRIVALRDLGVRLVEIAVLLDEEVPVEELRGILSLRRAEAHDRLASEAERLARVEARLSQLEEAEMTDYDVVVKSTDPAWVLGITETVGDVNDVGDA